MKFCRFQPLEFGVDAVGAPAHPEPLFGLLEGGSVRELLGDPLTEWRRGERAWPLERVRLLAPILPSKIVGVGRNYAEHAAEFSNPLPKEPMIFLKPPSSIIGPEEPIVLTPLSQNVHHEAEIAVVMGKTCSQLADGEQCAVLRTRLHLRKRRNRARPPARGRPMDARQEALTRFARWAR